MFVRGGVLVGKRCLVRELGREGGKEAGPGHPQSPSQWGREVLWEPGLRTHPSCHLGSLAEDDDRAPQ